MAGESIITLSIRETGADAGRAYVYHLRLDGEVVASNRSVAPADARALRELANRYNALFEQRRAPALSLDDQAVMGVQLFNLWLAAAWNDLLARIPHGARRTLVIASDVVEILNLPWELLRPPDGDHLGFDQTFSVRRHPLADRVLQPARATLPPRPLRILFMACSPRDTDVLDYEREEELLLRAIAKAGSNVAFDSGDLGTFDELRQRIVEFEPHVVHLTGHGVVARQCAACRTINEPTATKCGKCAAAIEDRPALGFFAFEDERGQTDLRSSVEIRRQLFAGGSVQCAFIAGCQTGQAPPRAALGGICQGLASGDVPLAVGMAASVADDIATQFAATFYQVLAAGQPIDRALTQARLGIRTMCEERGDPSWTLPVLYAATTQSLVFDTDRHRAAVPPPRMSVSQQPLPGMTEGYTRNFVGRRREIQRLLPALQDGSVQTVLITGLGGAGKSTLATRLARKLEAEGFRLIPVPSPEGTPLSAARLIESCADAFLAANLRDAYAVLGDMDLPIDARLRYLVTTLNENRFVLVLDNFETNLDETTRRILDADLAGFYSYLLDHLSGESRTIITSRYLPADVARLPSTALHEVLGDFPESAFLKFMLRDREVERRYQTGDLPASLLRDVHRLLGGAPRFLEQIREVLKTIPAAELRQALSSVVLPSDAEANALQKLRDTYCEQIVTARLYSYLPAESRQALSRAAVYNIAVTLEGLSAAAGVPPDQMRAFTDQWQAHALAYPERERGGDLWTIYGLLRSWLTDPRRLDPDQRRAAHLAAGDYLRELVAQKRDGELGLSWTDCLLEARAQYLAAGGFGQARAVTAGISNWFIRRGLYAEVERLNQELVSYEDHPGPMLYIAQSLVNRGSYTASRSWYQRALASSAESTSSVLALVSHELASLAYLQGDYPAAHAQFQQSLTIKQKLGDRVGEAETRHNLAALAMQQGDYPAAHAQFQHALTVQQELGDRAGEAATWHSLASLAMRQGDYPAARDQFQHALTVQQELGDRAGEAATWHSLGTLAFFRGHYPASMDQFQHALTVKQELGDRAGEADTLHNLATLAMRQGDYPAAHAQFQQSLTINQELGSRAGEAETRHNLAALAMRQGDYPAAHAQFQQSLTINQELGNRAGEAATWHSLASLAMRQGDYPAARDQFQHALMMQQELGDRAGEAVTWFQLGQLAARLGRPEQGIQLVALCYLIDQAIGHGETESVLGALSTMAAQLSFTQEQFDTMLREVAASYQDDRGRSLLDAAFGQDSEPS